MTTTATRVEKVSPAGHLSGEKTVVAMNPNPTTAGDGSVATSSKAIEKPKSFLDLPPELRNAIYKLSGSLEIYQCRSCSKTAYEEDHSVWDWMFVDRRTIAQTESKAKRVRVHRFFPFRRSPHQYYYHPKGAAKARIWVGGRCEPAQHLVKLFDDTYITTPELTMVRQPNITKVSKQVRADTLPMFYGGRQFYFTIFDDDKDGVAAILSWLEAIGVANAASLTDLAIVRSRKKTGNYLVGKEIWEKIASAGVRVDQGVMRLVKLEYPFCRCGRCVMETLRRKAPDEEDGGGKESAKDS